MSATGDTPEVWGPFCNAIPPFGTRAHRYRPWTDEGILEGPRRRIAEAQAELATLPFGAAIRPYLEARIAGATNELIARQASIARQNARAAQYAAYLASIGAPHQWRTP